MTLSEARLQAILKLLPAIQLFTLADAVLLSWYFWAEGPTGFLVGWTLIVALFGLGWWLYSHRYSQTEKTKPGHWRWLWFYAISEAVLFSTFIIVVFPVISADKAVVLGAFITGLLAAGALSKMSVPSAAYTFITCLTLGAGIGFLLSPFSSPWIAELMLTSFALALAILVGGMSKVFDARVMAEQELVRQKALVSDLLSDFGESTSEGFWEVDAQGRLTFLSPRLAELFGGRAEKLLGTFLVPEAEGAAVWSKPTGFRNWEVLVETSLGRRWWSLTGKPVKPDGVLKSWRGVASDVTGQRQNELDILRLSQYDSLTGLLNRRSFRTLLDEIFTDGALPARRSLVLIDLEHFKDFNESRGHAFEDALLIAVADRLRNCAPERMLLARLDGDEFALQGTVEEDPQTTLGNLSQLLKQLAEPYQVGEDRFEAGFNIGVSFTPDNAVSPDQWFRCTDLALRTAKTEGRNQVRAYDQSMMESFVERNTLREDLRGALARQELSVEYQPIVEMAKGRVAGFEALARWRHPTRGCISPAIFIPLAEESEIILQLGLWVLETACREALSWPQPLTVSVNVSGVQLRSGSLMAEVPAILQRVGFDPHRLILEVTESALVKNEHNLTQTFSLLKDMGIQWALDDFGTGYSSLSYLQDFPFSKLKIDQSFVRPQSSREPSRTLLGSIVALAKALNLSTTAEGIEDEEHWELLKGLGCAFGQGYLFSRPVPGPEVEDVVKRLS